MRQQVRRIVRKNNKTVAKRESREAAAALLKAMRASRLGSIKQGPGKLVLGGREFKKPHGQANWRVSTLLKMPNGDRIARGCEAAYHATKGLRVVRLPAAA